MSYGYYTSINLLTYTQDHTDKTNKWNNLLTCVTDESFVGAAMNTTYGAYSAVRSIFNA